MNYTIATIFIAALLWGVFQGLIIYALWRRKRIKHTDAHPMSNPYYSTKAAAIPHDEWLAMSIEARRAYLYGEWTDYDGDKEP